MAITLEEKSILPRTIKLGTEEIEASAERWLHYEYGTPEAPVQVLIAQVPAGKKWKVTMSVYIEETDA
jgi:hypothetical protein